jgi:16S rRNA (guanine966-N2)-methyltransferase
MPAAKLRITGGTARGIPVTEPKGLRLRPTSGLVREALFNILGDLVLDARVLDLYAGTGAVGIEALSRGAAAAVFVDAEAASCQAILQTLARANVAERARVLRGRLPAALTTLDETFSLIFMDPPYGLDTAEETLQSLPAYVSPAGLVVYEHATRYNPPERPRGLYISERRVYGDSALALYAVQEAE